MKAVAVFSLIAFVTVMGCSSDYSICLDHLGHTDAANERCDKAYELIDACVAQESRTFSGPPRRIKEIRVREELRKEVVRQCRASVHADLAKDMAEQGKP